MVLLIKESQLRQFDGSYDTYESEVIFSGRRKYDVVERLRVIMEEQEGILLGETRRGKDWFSHQYAGARALYWITETPEEACSE